MDKKLKKLLLNATERKDGSTRFLVVDQKAKPIISLWLISQDVEEMIACVERAVKVETITRISIDELIPKSLWEKMIISYGKIFSNSDDGFSKIEARHYFTSKRSLAIHENLIKTRNSYLAHRGYNDYEHCLMVMDLVQNDGKVKFEFSFPTAKQVGYFNKNRKSVLKHLQLLDKKVKDKLSQKVRKLEQFIIDDLKKK
jgi:hypothetical protein